MNKNKKERLPTLTRTSAGVIISELQIFQSIRHYSYTIYNAPTPILLPAVRRKFAVSVQFRLAPLQNPLAVV